MNLMRNTGMTSAHLSNMAVSKTAKFAEKMGDYVLFKNLDGKYLTLKDCIEENKKETAEAETEEKKEDTAAEENKDKAEEKEPEKTIIFYVTDEVQQSQYINMFKEAGKDAVILKHNIDSAVYLQLGAETSGYPVQEN